MKQYYKDEQQTFKEKHQVGFSPQTVADEYATSQRNAYVTEHYGSSSTRGHETSRMQPCVEAEIDQSIKASHRFITKKFCGNVIPTQRDIRKEGCESQAALVSHTSLSASTITTMDVASSSSGSLDLKSRQHSNYTGFQPISSKHGVNSVHKLLGEARASVRPLWNITEAVIQMLNQWIHSSTLSHKKSYVPDLCPRHLKYSQQQTSNVPEVPSRTSSLRLSLDKGEYGKPKEDNLKTNLKTNLKINRNNSYNNSSRADSRQFQLNDLEILRKLFTTTYYLEPPLGPRPPLQLPETTLWQYIWHVYDNKTLKVRWQRRKEKLYKNQPDSRQISLNPQLCNSSPLTWRHAWKSHIELTFFSIENVPYIAQVVIETESFRIDLPFNVQFLYIPIFAKCPNQVITIWFNSVYKSPYGRCYSKFLYSGEIPSASQLEDDDLENIEALASNDVTFFENYCNQEHEMLLLRQQQLMVYDNKPYHPRNHKWPCYFKLIIPVSVIREKTVIEGQTLLAPQGVFYESYENRASYEAIFQSFQELTYSKPLNPILKFHIKARIQGYQEVVYCGNDTLPQHLLSEPNPLQPEFFSASKFLYRPPYKATPSLSLRRLYIANVDDPIDQQVAIALNRRNQYLLRLLEKKSTTKQEPIICLYKGLYNIYQEEVHMKILKIDPRQDIWNFQDYHFEQDAPNINPEYPVFVVLPFVYDDDFYQPLQDYILQHRKNLQFLTIEKMHSQATSKNREIILPSLPNLILPNNKLPYEATQNPECILQLMQHAEAIKKNLIRAYLLNCDQEQARELLQTDYKIEKFIENLSPPTLRLDVMSSPKHVTFVWDEDLTNVRLTPVNDSLPFYLIPAWGENIP